MFRWLKPLIFPPKQKTAHHILLLLIITFRQMCGLNLGGKAWFGPLLKVEHCSCELHLVQNNKFFKGPCLGIRNYYYQRFAKYTSLFSKNFIRKPIQPCPASLLARSRNDLTSDPGARCHVATFGPKKVDPPKNEILVDRDPGSLAFFCENSESQKVFISCIN